MADSRIAWTEAVWNPVTGCSKVSAGCKHCYAERMAKRLAGRFGYPAEHPFAVTLHPEKLSLPIGWRKPRRIFVNSMSDLFHKDVPDQFIWRVFETIVQCPHHVFQILTKRPERMAEFVNGMSRDPLSNVWYGVSVEDQKTAEERIPFLEDMTAAVRWLSCEPLLGPIDFHERTATFDPLIDDFPNSLLTHVDWVVAGCESGPSARPMDLDWARFIRDECSCARVPFFFKQAVVDGKKVETPELDGRQWVEYPGKSR